MPILSGHPRASTALAARHGPDDHLDDFISVFPDVALERLRFRFRVLLDGLELRIGLVGDRSLYLVCAPPGIGLSACAAATTSAAAHGPRRRSSSA